MHAHEPFESVLEAARQGADWAWARLLDDVDGPLRRYVRRQGGADVDDLVGEAWLHVARGLNRFSGDEAAFRSWVFMIAHHRLIDERRRLARNRLELVADVDLEDSCEHSDSAEDTAMTHAAEKEMQRVLGKLPPNQREVIILRFVAGFGITEIARIIGKRPGAVSALQRRALKRLEKIFGKGSTFLP